MKLSGNQLATILHALRTIQGTGCAAGNCEHFSEFEQLSDLAIDDLCEEINVEGLDIISESVHEPLHPEIETPEEPFPSDIKSNPEFIRLSLGRDYIAARRLHGDQCGPDCPENCDFGDSE